MKFTLNCSIRSSDVLGGSSVLHMRAWRADQFIKCSRFPKGNHIKRANEYRLTTLTSLWIPREEMTLCSHNPSVLLMKFPMESIVFATSTKTQRVTVKGVWRGFFFPSLPPLSPLLVEFACLLGDLQIRRTPETRNLLVPGWWFVRPCLLG